MTTPLVFLSHAGADATAANAVAHRLRKADLEVWLDIDNLKPGDHWMVEIESAIARADVFLVYVGQAGIQSGVDSEVRVALDKNVKNRDFRIHSRGRPPSPSPCRAVLFDGMLPAGRHVVRWPSRGLPSGVYLVRLESAGAVKAQRLSLKIK